MNTVESPTTTAESLPPDGGGPAWLTRLDGFLERSSDWLNPILVKEARQALKSRQFLICFSLVLGLGWGWSLLGIAILSPGVYYNPGGPLMLSGYVVILSLPVLLMVPFVAFRSLAGEVEDGTFELLSITALNARQIVTGKLGSATLQMLVYFSALAPCVVFTYMLRGVDIFTTGSVLVYGLLASLLLAAVGLLFATLARSRMWQGFLSVGLVLLLLFVGWLLVTGAVVLINEAQIPYQESGFWEFNAIGLLVYLSVIVLLVLATASQITFASANRSTRIRIVLVVQQMLWIGFIVTLGLWTNVGSRTRFPPDWLQVACLFPGAYWAVMGMLLNAEQARLSPRVQRQLPQSFLGRTAFTWFNPGSVTGYVFCIANVITLILVCIGVELVVRQTIGTSRRQSNDGIWTACLLLGYLALYLGLARFLIVLVRRFIGGVGLLAALLVQLAFGLLAAVIPSVIQVYVFDVSSYQPSWQVLNWGWTLAEAADHGLDHSNGPDVLTLAVVSALAFAVLLANLILAVPDASVVRVSLPARIALDDAQGEPELPRTSGSPWDEPDTT